MPRSNRRTATLGDGYNDVSVCEGLGMRSKCLFFFFGILTIST